MTAALSDHLLAEGFAPGVIESARIMGPGLVGGLWSTEEVDRTELLESLGRFFDLPVAMELKEELTPDQLHKVPPAYYKSHGICPLKLEGEILGIGHGQGQEGAVDQ